MSHYFQYKTAKINYTDKGRGKIIVLLHGYLESSEVWNGFEERLASKFRVIAVYLPGHGFSDVIGESHTMEFMATIVKELLESLDIQKVILAGHSLGGYVALAFLELFPEYLSGYCLFHSQPFPDSQEAHEKRKREIVMVAAGKKDMIYPENIIKMFSSSNLEKFSEDIKQLKDIASRIPGDGIIAVLKGMMVRPSRLAVMEEGRVPCLWILGLMDNYIACDIIQGKINLPSNARLCVLTKSGHIGFIEEEDRAVEVVSDFVEELKS